MSARSRNWAEGIGIAVLLLGAIPGFAFIPQDDAHVEGLIRHLDGLGDDFTRDQFLQRPALMELIALVDTAAPALSRAVKTSDSWSIRASAAYVLYVNKLHPGVADSVDYSWGALMQDPHPMPRVIACLAVGSGTAMESLAKPEHSGLHVKVFRPQYEAGQGPLDWMPEEFARRRMRRLVDIADAAKPFSGDLPDWGFIETVYADRASFAFQGLASGIQESKLGHEFSDAVLEKLRAESSIEDGSLGYWFELAFSITNHRDQSHKTGVPCPREGDFSRALCGEIERRIWDIDQPFALTAMLNLLPAIGTDDALKLLVRVEAAHSLEKVRSLASWHLKTIASTGERFEVIEQMRRFQKAVEEARLREKRESRVPTATPSEVGKKPNLPEKQAPVGNANENGWGNTPWIAGILVILLGLGISALRWAHRRGVSRS